MKRPLLVAATTATLVVGAVCGVTAHAFASEPRAETAVVSVKPLVVPTGHQPSSFAADDGTHTLADGKVVVAAHKAVDLDAPVAPPGAPTPPVPGPIGLPAAPGAPGVGATPPTPGTPAGPGVGAPPAPPAPAAPPAP
ncbi:MAG: hypothetical protein JWN36_2315, partial [Microbacteriaceae bacterium]|nr:hypothetical protein [Microbacteriaceae bacterium]